MSPLTATASTKWHPATKLLLAAGALAVPYLLWTQPETAPAPAAPAAEAPVADAPGGPTQGQPGAAPALYVMPPLERFTAVVERPLFSPTRRMPAIPEPPPEQPASVAEAAPAGPSGPEEPDLRFFGTVRQGDRSAALVTFPSTSEVARLVPGDHVGPWAVVEVERNRLVLAIGEERRSFEIFGASLRQPPTEATAPKPPRARERGPEAGAAGGRAAAARGQAEEAAPEPDAAGVDGAEGDVPPDAEMPPEEGDLGGEGANGELPAQE